MKVALQFISDTEDMSKAVSYAVPVLLIGVISSVILLYTPEDASVDADMRIWTWLSSAFSLLSAFLNWPTVGFFQRLAVYA